MESTAVLPKVEPALWAGVACGVVGLLVFLTIHHFWIQPIWFILPMGLLLAGAAGLIFALGPGHNIPFLGSTPAAGKGAPILLAVVVASAVVLVELELRLGGGGR